MRLNKYLAQGTGLSRRAADAAVTEGSVLVNGQQPQTGQDITPDDLVMYKGQPVSLRGSRTILLHKPAGYVVSRNGQGSKTVYDLLPPDLHHLKPVGRLDKDSSGLLLLTSDGGLANELTHPSYEKTKVYEIVINKPLAPADEARLSQGISVEDYLSQLELKGSGEKWTITMHQGKNRQIRKTFEVLGYTVTALHRINFGPYLLGTLAPGQWQDKS